MTSRLPTLEFGGFATYRVISELERVVRNENGKNKRFKYEFKRRLAFLKVGLNSQVGSQVAHFRNLIHRLRNLKLNL